MDKTPVLFYTTDNGCPHCKAKKTLTVGTQSNANFFCINCRAIFTSLTSNNVDARGEFTGRYAPATKETLYNNNQLNKV